MPRGLYTPRTFPFASAAQVLIFMVIKRVARVFHLLFRSFGACVCVLRVRKWWRTGTLPQFAKPLNPIGTVAPLQRSAGRRSSWIGTRWGSSASSLLSRSLTEQGFFFYERIDLPTSPQCNVGRIEMQQCSTEETRFFFHRPIDPDVL